MTEITVSGEPCETVFDLLGKRENGITYALGWGLAQSDDLLRRFLQAAGAGDADPSGVALDLQRYRRFDDRAGITDIEITSPSTHVIVEAKRGWSVPSRDQLLLYLPALLESQAVGKDARFVVLTLWGEREHVEHVLGAEIDGIPIATVGLAQVAELAREVAAAERRLRYRQLMTELAGYLRGVAHMRDLHDNRVYVVSLGKTMSEAGIPLTV